MGYYKPPKTGQYHFWVTGTNIGARLMIEEKIPFGADALFPQAHLNLRGEVLLNEGFAYQIDLLLLSFVMTNLSLA
jgi:hypothetical protein